MSMTLLRRIKGSVLILSCLVILATSTSAQRTITPSTLTMLDSALGVIGMCVADMRMPADLIDPDRHRMVLHDILFNEPLRAFDVSDYIADAASLRTEAGLSTLFSLLMQHLDLGVYHRVSFDGQITADGTIRLLSNDPTTHLDLVSSFIVLRYLSAIVQVNEAIKWARKRVFEQGAVIDHIDSLWRLSRDDESLTLWAISENEERSRVIAETVYAQAAPRVAEDIYVYGLSLYQQLMVYVAQSDQNHDLMSDSVTSFTFMTPMGRVAVGGPGNDVYLGSYAVIVDVGGNDIYRLDDSTKTDALGMPIRCIIDLAGDDTYTSRDFSLATGLVGVGIVIDRKGNDIYSAGDFSIGCGIFGIGILHDVEGNDTYLSGSNTQGAGIFGLGIVLDDQGHDTYKCHAQAQAFGATRGAGILSDVEGNDRYIASSPYVDVLRYDAHQVTFTQGAALGARPIASGGIGILVDGKGNDLYVSDIYGQGTGYWFGLGALIDRSGDDRYESYQYAQGAGVHFATGILRDSKGDDVYISHGVSQGCGHDVAFGALLDDAGNDVYVCESLSLGGGNANAVSLFVDERGNDAYIASNESNTMGYSDFRRSYGMIGVFLDGGGSDVYGERSRNNTVTTKSTYGVFVDRDVNSTLVESSREAQTDSMPLTTSVDSLFIQASAAHLRFQNNVEPARKQLGQMGAVAIAGLESHFATRMPRERLTLENVLPLLYVSDQDSMSNTLIRGLNADDATIVTICATVAGKVKGRQFIQPLIVATLDASWKRRRLAAYTLGEIGDTSARSALMLLLHDEHPYVRQRAAFALGKMGGTQFETLREALEDEDQIVRHAAVEGLLRGPRLSMRQITSWMRTINDRSTLISALRLISNAGTTKDDLRTFSSWLKGSPKWLQEAAKRAGFKTRR